MAKTIEQLKAQSAEIKNATVVGENTATRVGALFNDIVDALAAEKSAIMGTERIADKAVTLPKLSDEIVKRSNVKNRFNPNDPDVKIGYYIEKEELVKDADIIYTIIQFRHGYRFYTKKQLYFGPYLLNPKWQPCASSARTNIPLS